MILLLTIALRVLVLAQFTAREKLKEQGQKLSGIYADSRAVKPTARLRK
ncbi:MAG: hypothetical protein ACRD82_12585 [Blastocatellia bacterium]